MIINPTDTPLMIGIKLALNVAIGGMIGEDVGIAAIVGPDEEVSIVVVPKRGNILEQYVAKFKLNSI